MTKLYYCSNVVKKAWDYHLKRFPGSITDNNGLIESIKACMQYNNLFVYRYFPKENVVEEVWRNPWCTRDILEYDEYIVGDE